MRYLHVNPSDATPIWSQIEEGIRRLVASGALRAGGSIPSVRDLARELTVNPATVAKAYQRLTDAGVLTVKRGEGTYVSDSPPIMGKIERSKTLKDGAARYASLAVTIGAEAEEAARELTVAWKQLGDGTRPGGKKP